MAKKKTYYFPHDFGARNDSKLMEVLMELGLAGIGAYWCVIELLYEAGGELLLSSCRNLAFSLHCETSLIERLVRDFGLFENDGVKFWSEAVNARVNKIEELAQKRRDAIAKRWGKTEENTIVSENNTNVCETNTIVSGIDTIEIQNKIKENKRKEKKINNINNLNNNVVLCQNSGGAGFADTKQQGINITDVEKYFFVEARKTQAERIAERFWNFNGTFDWQTSKGKVKNPIYAAKMWKIQPEEEGGHACRDKALASKYFDFAKKCESLHPDAGKLLTGFIDVSVSGNEVNFTFNSDETADICETILQNQNLGAKDAFSSIFGAKTLNYTIAE